MMTTADHSAAGTVNIGPDFLRAGKAVFTVENPAGEHYTFRIVKCGEKHHVPRVPKWFAQLLTGPDNECDYTYLGVYDPHRIAVDATFKSKLPADSKPFRVLRWAVAVLHGRQPLPAGYQIRHEGRCGRCARTLTTPESLDCGIGPECRKLMGVEQHP